MASAAAYLCRLYPGIKLYNNFRFAKYQTITITSGFCLHCILAADQSQIEILIYERFIQPLFKIKFTGKEMSV